MNLSCRSISFISQHLHATCRYAVPLEPSHLLDGLTSNLPAPVPLASSPTGSPLSRPPCSSSAPVRGNRQIHVPLGCAGCKSDIHQQELFTGSAPPLKRSSPWFEHHSRWLSNRQSCRGPRNQDFIFSHSAETLCEGHQGARDPRHRYCPHRSGRPSSPSRRRPAFGPVVVWSCYLGPRAISGETRSPRLRVSSNETTPPGSAYHPMSAAPR